MSGFGASFTPSFGFGASSSSSTPSLGFGASYSSSTPCLGFGASSSSSTPCLGFGASSSSSAPSFGFGASSSSSTPSLGFGASYSSSAPSFGFGASSSSITPSLGFGVCSSSSAPSMGFGASSSSSTPSYGFCASSSTTTSSSSSLLFGSSTSGQTTPSPVGFRSSAASNASTLPFASTSSAFAGASSASSAASTSSSASVFSLSSTVSSSSSVSASTPSFPIAGSSSSSISSSTTTMTTPSSTTTSASSSGPSHQWIKIEGSSSFSSSTPPPPSSNGEFSLKNRNATSSGNAVPVNGGGSRENEKTSIHDDGDEASEHETVKEVISLKVAVERKNNRVVFAETKNDFLDVIFSFLTLPIGTILSLLQGKSHDIVIGCMNNLYESVRHLGERLFRTEACKEMLLHPRRLSESQCSKLKLKYDENLKTPKSFYFCQNGECRWPGRAKLSEFPNVHCLCGMLMDQLATLSEQAGTVNRDEEGGVFMKGGSELFLLTDNMQVMPGLTSLSLQLLKKLGINDANELEIQSVDVGPEKVMQLLGQAFVSGTPLTHCILSEKNSPVLAKDEQENSANTHIEQSKTNDGPFPSKAEQMSSTGTLEEHSKTNKSKRMRLVFFIRKSNNVVLYAECEEDFVDFIFSFLTFPLGSMLKILDANSQLRNFDSLYRSVTDLGVNGHLKSEELKDMLLCPILAPYFACGNQLLRVEECRHPQYKLYVMEDGKIEWFVQPASPEYDDFTYSVANPKSPAGESKQGGGFVKGPAKFMVTDDLTVKLLSPIESISIIGKSNVPITDVHEISVEVGIDEAKSLLRAALISKTALTDVLKEKLESNLDEKLFLFPDVDS